MKTKKTFQHLGPKTIGMNLSLFVLVFVSILLCSCQNSDKTEQAEKNENWAELFFEERLSSISAESDTSCFYLGTEDGAFFTYNEDGIKKYNTPFDRIYCVKQDKNNQGHYWVGTRNMGLHYCKLVGDSLVKQQSFTIPDKDDRFSVYDICTDKDKDTLYLATSHGLFAVSSRVPLSTGSTINLEQRWSRNKTDVSPVVVGKLCPFNGKLYFTTSDGIYKYNKGKNEAVISVPDTVMLPSLSRGQDGTIQAIIEDKLYTIDSLGYDSVPVAHRCIDFVITPDYIYQVSKDSLYVTNRTNHNNGTGKRALPSPARRECRNLIFDDVAHDQVLLVTSHHLLRIPHHYSLPTHKNVRVGISATCSDGDKAYFLFANKVFQLNPGDTVAKEKCTLIDSHHPSRITVYGDSLYYVAEKKVYCKNMNNGNEDSCALTNEPTALGCHKGNVYIGVRDSLLLFKDGQLKSDPINIKLMRKKGSDQLEEAKYPFITAFCLKGDSLLIATLNDGVYIGQDDHFEEAFSGDSLRFIRDIAIQGNNTFILTHRGLWRHSSDPQAASPHQYIASKGFNHLLVNDQSVTLIADFGLREFMIHGDTVDTEYHSFYQDWSFRPELSFMKDSTMVISRNNGVLMIKKPLDKSSTIHWLEFRPSWRPGDNLLLVLTCAAVALMLLLLVWWLMHRKHKREMQTKEQEDQKTIELRNRLRRQINTIRSNRLVNYEDIKLLADKAYDSNDASKLESLMLSNKELLDAVAAIKSWLKIWGDGAPSMYVPEKLNPKRKELIRFINDQSRKDPSECERRIDTFLDYATGNDVIGQVKERLEELLVTIQRSMDEAKVCEPQATDVLKAQLDTCQRRLNVLNDILAQSDSSMSEDEVVDVLKEVKTIGIRHQMTRGIIDLANCLYGAQHPSSADDYSLLAMVDEYQDRLNSKADPFIAKLRSQLKEMATNAWSAIERIYDPWTKGLDIDGELLELIKTSPTTGKVFVKGKGDETNITVRGAVVALLLSGVDLSNNEMKILLDEICRKRETDYKKEKSNVNIHLDDQREQLEEYAALHPTSIARFLI